LLKHGIYKLNKSYAIGLRSAVNPIKVTLSNNDIIELESLASQRDGGGTQKRYAVMAKVTYKTAVQVCEAIIDAHKLSKARAKKPTYDNG
jgi:hypothetical protein